MENEITHLSIFMQRSGTVTELVQFLTDLELAYNSLIIFYIFLQRDKFQYFPFEYPLQKDNFQLDKSNIDFLPEYWLEVKRVNINSPGFWEFLGSLNALEQIRKYLNERHERQKDHRWREQTDRVKAIRENQLIETQIMKENLEIIKERIQIYRDIGLTDLELRKFIMENIGNPLKQLANHQDTGLITTASGEMLPPGDKKKLKDK